MPGMPIPPEAVIDMEIDQEKFRSLVSLSESTRLFVIQDQADAGKTTLLLRLLDNCKRMHHVPACLVDLGNDVITAPIDLVTAIRSGLGQLKFPTFDRLDFYRADKNFSAFGPDAATFAGIVDARGTVTTGSTPTTYTGLNLDLKNADTVQVNVDREWSAARERIAVAACIAAFLDDLRTLANQQPVVIMLDTFEGATSLRNWIVYDFLQPCCFDAGTHASNLVIVLAGTDTPDFRLNLHERHNAIVWTTDSPRAWQREHIVAVLHLHGYADLLPDAIDDIWDWVNKGNPIGRAFLLADAYRVLADTYRRVSA